MLKTIVVSDNGDTKYTYCAVADQYQMVPEAEFQIMLKSPGDYKLSGFPSLLGLKFGLKSSTFEGSDKRTTIERNLELMYGEIKNNVKSITSEIAALLFAETSLNGFLQPGFKMHVLKKSSVKHYGEIDVKTTELKSLLTDWGHDIDNGD